MDEETWTVRIDGASRGNPGAAAYAVVIERPDQPVYEEADRLGQTTNNIAEYTALVRALERAARMGGRRLTVLSDSELLVKQMNGEYRVKNEELKGLHARATELLQPFERVSIRHVRRKENARADKLCNAALDGKPQPLDPIEVAVAATPTPAAAPAAKSKRSAAPAAIGGADLRDRVVGCLRRAAKVWAAEGDATFPSPEKVWDEIWGIVSESALGRPPASPGEGDDSGG